MNYQLALPPHEEWRDIKGYEGHYQISNLGRARSLCREKVVRKSKFSNGHRIYRERILKCGGTKYRVFGLAIQNNKPKYFLAHRLVAQAFIPNPENKTRVCHIDDNPNNNVAWNLFWGTQRENMQDCYKKGRGRWQKENLIEYLHLLNIQATWQGDKTPQA